MLRTVINSLIAAWNERKKENYINYADDREITIPGV